MLYTNYKQVAKLVLKSTDATQEVSGTELLEDGGAPVNIVSKFTYNIKLPFIKFGKNTKLAIENFSTVVPASYDMGNIADIYIKNIHKKNIYHSAELSANGTCILSYPIEYLTEYINTDVINNSIDITGNTSFMEGNPLDIFVDTKIFKYNDPGGGAPFNRDGTITGCPDDLVWSLTLLVYEEEKEENAKDFVDDRARNYGRPALY